MSDRRAYQQEWEDQPGYSDTAPLSDALASTRTIPVNKDSGKRYPAQSSIVAGKIVESMGYLRTYRVLLENNSVVQCTTASHQGVSPWGPSDIATYGPGDEVLVYMRSSVSYGVIVAAIHPPVQEPLDYRPDVIFSGSNVGYFVDGTCNYWAGQDSNDTIDFSAGRPVDGTAGPEGGSQGLTGVGFFHDDFMAMLKVDEATGVFGFYDDSLLRIAGRNLQIRSSGLEHDHLNDEGEVSGYRGLTPYVWEAMGTFKPGVKSSGHVLDVSETTSTSDPGDEDGTTGDPEEADGTTEDPGEDGTTDAPTEPPEIEGIRHGFIQPMAYDQQSFHRSVQFEGYLGQGGRDTVIVPGPDVEGNEDSLVNTYSQDLRFLGLYAQQKHLTGKQVSVSSGGFLFVKRPPLPVPKRRERPESPLGDLNAAVAEYRKNYDACGLAEEDDQLTTEEPPTTGEPGSEEPTTEAPYVVRSTHKVVAEIPFEELTTSEPSGDSTTQEGEPTTIDPAELTKQTVPDEVVRLAMIADEIAYTLGWEGLHTFHYHSKDYYLPNESELGEFNKSVLPVYSSLSRYQYLGEDPESVYPETISVKVDHRYGEVKIYLNTAVFGLKADGNFILQSGCGASIKSVAGNLELTAPGDIIMRPGRNLVALSGHDTVIKARNSVDISASENDIRMVAWSNFMVGGAVGGTGAMLFQSFSTCIVDPEKSNRIQEPTTTPDPDEPTEEPTTVDPEEPTKSPTYFLGEEVVGSGILFKSARAQITLSSKEANIEVGRKVYEDEGDEEEYDPAPVDPNTGVIQERKWSWEGGKFRVKAEFGDIEMLGSYHVHYISAPGGFSSEGFSSDVEGASGALLQVFVNRAEMTGDEADSAQLEPNELPPNILAAAGTADLSARNSCNELDGQVCYQVLNVNEFRADRTNFCSQVLISTELFVGGCAYVRGNAVIFDHVESNFQVRTFNGALNGQRQDVVATFAEADTRCRQLLPPLAAELLGKFVTTVTGSWLDYSCRTLEQYGTAQTFCLMETEWQHQIRVAAEAAALADPDPDNPPPAPGTPEHAFNYFPKLPTGLSYWQEMYVVTDYANKQRTAPYPGLDYVHYEEATTEEPPVEPTTGDPSTEEPTTEDPAEEAPRLARRAYGVYKVNMVDEINQRPVDRDATYEPPTDEDGEPIEDGANIYEDPRLKRSWKLELSHYIAVDVIGSTTTTTTTTTTEEP